MLRAVASTRLRADSDVGTPESPGTKSIHIGYMPSDSWPYQTRIE